MTVLRNDGTLPLAQDTRVALIGRNALETTCMGGGSAQVRAPHQVSVAEGLTSRLGDGVTVVDGVAVRSRPRKPRRDLVTDPVTGVGGVRVRVYDASGQLIRDDVAAEGYTDVHLDDDARRPARAQLSAIVPAGAQRLGVLGAGDWTFRAGDFAGSAAPRMDTQDLAEAILRPPGWEIDVVLDEPTEVVAEVDLSGFRLAHSMLGLVVEPTPPDRRRGHRGRGRRRGAAPTWRSSWSGSPRSRRPRRSTSPRSPSPADRTSSSRPSRPRHAGPSSW